MRQWTDDIIHTYCNGHIRKKRKKPKENNSQLRPETDSFEERFPFFNVHLIHFVYLNSVLQVDFSSFLFRIHCTIVRMIRISSKIQCTQSSSPFWLWKQPNIYHVFIHCCFSPYQMIEISEINLPKRLNSANASKSWICKM